MHLCNRLGVMGRDLGIGLQALGRHLGAASRVYGVSGSFIGKLELREAGGSYY